MQLPLPLKAFYYVNADAADPNAECRRLGEIIKNHPIDVAFIGIGEKYYPVPWSMLDYNEDKGGYVVPLSKDTLENAPSYDLKDLIKHDGSLGDIRETSYTYYKVDRDWH